MKKVNEVLEVKETEEFERKRRIASGLRARRGWSGTAILYYSMELVKVKLYYELVLALAGYIAILLMVVNGLDVAQEV